MDSSNPIKSYLSEVHLEEKSTCDLIVTYVETIYDFYVQQECTETGKMMEELQLFYESRLNLAQPLLALHNACVYHDKDETKRWYRARIDHLIDEHHSVVKLVDYGSKKYVNNASLKQIGDKFLTYPCQAISASLADMYEMRDQATDDQLHNKFRSLAHNKQFLGKVQKIVTLADQSKKYLFNMFDVNMESLYKNLVEDFNESESDVTPKCIVSRLNETSIMNETTMLSEPAFLDASQNKFQHKQCQIELNTQAKDQALFVVSISDFFLAYRKH